MEDSFGNPVHFVYDTQTDAGSAYVVKITYGAGASPISGAREVRLRYEERPDPLLSFPGGLRREVRERLREIKVLGHGEVYRRYVFGYVDLNGETYETERSRLAWVQEFGTDCDALGTDPIAASCSGLPPRTFTYYDNDADGWKARDELTDSYRIPFGTYPHHLPQLVGTAERFPQLIGDVNGDGLPDRIELMTQRIAQHHAMEPDIDAEPILDLPAIPRVWLNTGAGFERSSGAAGFEASLGQLHYDRPRFDYEQLPVYEGQKFVEDWWGYESQYTFCEIAPHTFENRRLADDLLPAQVIGAEYPPASELAPYEAPAPVAGWIAPRPSVQLADVDGDGLSDLIVSARVSGLVRHFDCNGSKLQQPDSVPGVQIARVYRNTGSGWVDDQEARDLAVGLPAFEELVIKSTYSLTQLYADDDSPLLHRSEMIYYRLSNSYRWPTSSCADLGLRGFGQNYIEADDPSTPEADNEDPQHISRFTGTSGVCYASIPLAPVFRDFNGDGLLDVAVLVRDDPDRIWTGPDDPHHSTMNRAKTRVWVQTPDGPQRWAEAPQYDLPADLTLTESQGGYHAFVFAHAILFHEPRARQQNLPECYTWHAGFRFCSGAVQSSDPGLRFLDLNRDGLTDVLWSGPGGSGVLLNTGSGTGASRAWCISREDTTDVAQVGGSCPEAAEFLPPEPIAEKPPSSRLAVSTGMPADLNGDGWLDFVRIVNRLDERSSESWIYDPGAAEGSHWIADPDYTVPIGTSEFPWYRAIGAPNPDDSDWWMCEANYECQWAYILSGMYAPHFPTFQALDIDGDGDADVVGDLYAFINDSPATDLLESASNGRGGSIHFEYQSAPAQRADFDARSGEEHIVELWAQSPVVTRVTLRAPEFGDSETSYQYAEPRFCLGKRSSLGFVEVDITRPDGSRIEERYYEDHGRAGRIDERRILEGLQVVHRYGATWQLVAGPIPGQVSGASLARLIAETTQNEYASGAGAAVARTLAYDDLHGYNFVKEVRTVRSTGTLSERRTPFTDLDRWVIGLAAARTLGTGSGEVLGESSFGFHDLDGDFVGPKPGVVSRRLGPDPATAGLVEVSRRRYDDYGNLLEEQTRSPADDSSFVSTLHCYDGGNEGWCSGEGVAGQRSRSVRVATQDPLGHVMRAVPDAASGRILATESDYVDEPATRTELDSFSRPSSEFATPENEPEVRLTDYTYHDFASEPLRTERFDYTDKNEQDWIYSASVAGAFGGTWKAIRRTPRGAGWGFVGTASYRDPGLRLARTTQSVDCGPDPTCTNLIGDLEPLARETLADALGRPLSEVTPDGVSLLHYSAAVEQIASQSGAKLDAPVDVVLHQNAKGDLTRQSVDGDRVIAVEECTNSQLGRASLAGVPCSAGLGQPVRTLYAYRPDGLLEAIHDPVSVANPSVWDDARHTLRYGLDALGRVVRIEDPDAGESLTTYDLAGNVRETDNARGLTRVYSYDTLGRMTGIETPQDEPSYTLTYSATKLRVTKEESSEYSKTYHYDGFGRRTSERLHNNPGGSYQFDLAGRRIYGHYTGLPAIHYRYEGRYLMAVCEGGAFDCFDGDKTTYLDQVEYDVHGRLKSYQTPAGLRSYEYQDEGGAGGSSTDTRRHLRKDLFTGPSGTFDRTYSDRDALANVVTMSTTGSLAGGARIESFGYDHRNRLASWSPGVASEAHYRYDALGNLTHHGTGSASAQNQFYDGALPHAVSRRSGAETLHFGYDGSGNRDRVSVEDGGTTWYRYDSTERLVCVGTEEGACDLLHVTYDVQGQRVREVAAGTERFFIGDEYMNEVGGPRRVQLYAFGERIAYHERGMITEESQAPPLAFLAIELPLPLLVAPVLAAALWLLGLGVRGGLIVGVARRPGYAGLSGVLIVSIAIPFPVRGGGGLQNRYNLDRWILSDPLGSGLVVLDENGGLVRSSWFRPFGAVESELEPAPVGRHHYAGHPEQEETGLVYMKARWMDPSTGTFLSVDPLVPAYDDPQSLNAYAYARNNPVSYTDPTGRTPIEVITVYGYPYDGSSLDVFSANLITSTFPTAAHLVAGNFIAGMAHVHYAELAGTGGGGAPTGNPAPQLASNEPIEEIVVYGERGHQNPFVLEGSFDVGIGAGLKGSIPGISAEAEVFFGNSAIADAFGGTRSEMAARALIRVNVVGFETTFGFELVQEGELLPEERIDDAFSKKLRAGGIPFFNPFTNGFRSDAQIPSRAAGKLKLVPGIGGSLTTGIDLRAPQ